jgi:hypothetical protein
MKRVFNQDSNHDFRLSRERSLGLGKYMFIISELYDFLPPNSWRERDPYDAEEALFSRTNVENGSTVTSLNAGLSSNGSSSGYSNKRTSGRSDSSHMVGMILVRSTPRTLDNSQSFLNGKRMVYSIYNRQQE